ncbi:hypothetical protein BCR37DRAFT_393847 [Protomyces lactucae-debilis]|uniref:Uncharacterized protein n=1 Tax=Protomyces lactucae-debilis TaxID=2754530 RepID=A0A1Y2F9B0_PROLT|nr:uncharacterized protein BCR37DRAFT_393847 [Protomyces lactucae-debilis]ORY80491.1 hypothetical protein BCR37DRAFT_393847 [Protomyces lactucae-debilis]
MLLQRSKQQLNPTTPSRALVKSNLTSRTKRASFVDDTTPTKAACQYLLNTSTDLTTPMIDGSTSNSPAHTLAPPKAAPVMSAMTGIKLTPAAALAAATEASKIANANLKRAKAYLRSEAMRVAITSLDDIMYTNDFLLPGDTRKVSAVPVLECDTESLSRKEKRRRKKLRTAATGAGGLGKIGGSASSMDGDYSTGENEEFGVDRAGHGIGPSLEPLFSL